MTKTIHEYLLNPDGTKAYELGRHWEVQPPPFKAPLPYGYDKVRTRGSFTSGSGDVSYYDVGLVTVRDDYTVDAQNKCYAALVNKLGDPSTMANNLMEVSQSVGMIVSRANQIGRFVSALRRGNIAAASKALQTPTLGSQKTRRLEVKNLGDQFLEFHFGWVPLVQDIGSALSVLSNTRFGERRLTATSSIDIFDREVVEGHDQWTKYSTVNNRQNTFRCKMGVTVRIINPNVHLANQLGLINPYAIAWEAVPFSFVVDWFGNVGQLLGSCSDFASYSIENAYTTSSTEINLDRVDSHVSTIPSENGNGACSGHRIKIGRDNGIRFPKLRFRIPPDLSITRAATAISLLLQKMK